MKRCLDCGASAFASAWQCGQCGKNWRPQRSDGVLKEIPEFAPAFATQNDGFQQEFYDHFANEEPKNWWFRSRANLLVWALKRYAPSARSWLELGCGTGFLLERFEREFPNLVLHGSEIMTRGLEYVQQRVKRAALYQLDARHIPFEAEFDAVGAFDVIEHIEEDSIVLNSLANALKPGGMLFLTVPQHTFLWSAADDYAHHKRRYGRAELDAKLRSAGFEPIRYTSFVALLLPAMLFSRLTHRTAQRYDPRAEFALSPLLNRAFEVIANIEQWFIRLGISWPLGGSLLAIARKKDTV